MLEGVDGQVVQRDGQRIQRDLAGSVEAVEKCFVESEDDRRWRRRPVLIDELGVLVRGFDSGHASVEPGKNQSNLVKQEMLFLYVTTRIWVRSVFPKDWPTDQFFHSFIDPLKFFGPKTFNI